MKGLYVSMVLMSLCVCGQAAVVKMNTDKTFISIDSMMGNANMSKKEVDVNKIVFMLKELRQLYANGTAIGDANDISNLNLTFGKVMNTTTKPMSRMVEGSSRNKVNDATIKFSFEIFTEDNNLTTDGEMTTVMAGDVRVSISVDSYKFNQTDNKLQMKLEIAGPESATMKESDKTDGVAYSLGANGYAMLSKKVEVEGGSFVNVTPTAAKNMFTIVIPGNTILKYGVVLKLADFKKPTTDDNSASSVTVFSSLVATMLAVHKLLA